MRRRYHPRARWASCRSCPTHGRELRAALNLGSDPYDPHDNITAGAAYLRWLHDRYGDAGFLAAYNAGPGRYEELLRSSRTLPDETKKYVARVARLLRGKSLGDPVFDADFVDRPHAEMLSGNQLFVGPFASRDAAQDAPDVMPIFVQVMRSEAPPHGLFVPISQRSAP